jgi:nitrate reductase delta subunit
MAESVHPLKLCSLLLQYPSGQLWEARGELRAASEALPAGKQREGLLSFLAATERATLATWQRRYVAAFDFSRRNSLHLTYHRWGDLRQRGMAMLRLKQRFDEAGLELSDGELPDYLPVLLEFAALDCRRGEEALSGQREAIELVRSSLNDEGSPYATLLDAVAAGLPRLTRRQATRTARLAAEGPPSEEVGLEPFAPPEVMPMPGGRPASPLPGGAG